MIYEAGEVVTSLKCFLYKQTDLSSDPSTYVICLTYGHASVIPVLGKQIEEGSWAVMAKQTRRIGKVQIQWETLSQKVQWRVTEEDN